MAKRVRRISETSEAPQRAVAPQGVEEVTVRYVSDERVENEMAILETRELADTLVAHTEDFLRRLNELSFQPQSQEAAVAYMTLVRAASQFKILQTEIHNFSG